MSDTYNLNDLNAEPEMPEEQFTDEQFKELISGLKKLRRVNAPENFRENLFARIRQSENEEAGKIYTLPARESAPSAWGRMQSRLRPAYAIAAVLVIGALMYELYPRTSTIIPSIQQKSGSSEIAQNAPPQNVPLNIVAAPSRSEELRAAPGTPVAPAQHETAHDLIRERSSTPNAVAVHSSPRVQSQDHQYAQPAQSTMSSMPNMDAAKSQAVTNRQSYQYSQDNQGNQDNRVIQAGEQMPPMPTIILQSPNTLNAPSGFSTVSAGDGEATQTVPSINDVDPNKNAAQNALQEGIDSLHARQDSARNSIHKPKK